MSDADPIPNAWAYLIFPKQVNEIVKGNARTVRSLAPLPFNRKHFKKSSSDSSVYVFFTPAILCFNVIW